MAQQDVEVLSGEDVVILSAIAWAEDAGGFNAKRFSSSVGVPLADVKASIIRLQQRGAVDGAQRVDWRKLSRSDFKALLNEELRVNASWLTNLLRAWVEHHAGEFDTFDAHLHLCENCLWDADDDDEGESRSLVLQ